MIYNNLITIAGMICDASYNDKNQMYIELDLTGQGNPQHKEDIVNMILPERLHQNKLIKSGMSAIVSGKLKACIDELWIEPQQVMINK